MSKELLEQNLNQYIASIKSCMDQRFFMPALILIYCGIDIMASLNRPRDKNRADRSDFIEWCNEYVLPCDDLKCTSKELYAARCGVVHTYTSESDLSKKGEAREVVYSQGNRKAKEFQDVIDFAGVKTHVAIRIDTLFEAFASGVERFLKDVAKDSEKNQIIYKRVRMFFEYVSEPI